MLSPTPLSFGPSSRAPSAGQVIETDEPAANGSPSPTRAMRPRCDAVVRMFPRCGVPSGAACTPSGPASCSAVAPSKLTMPVAARPIRVAGHARDARRRPGDRAGHFDRRRCEACRVDVRAGRHHRVEGPLVVVETVVVDAEFEFVLRAGADHRALAADEEGISAAESPEQSRMLDVGMTFESRNAEVKPFGPFVTPSPGTTDPVAATSITRPGEHSTPVLVQASYAGT